MSQEQIQAIEQSIKRAKGVADFGTAIERLRVNKDFKKVVLEGYFEQEAIRLVHLKADPSMQSADSQKSIISQMDAIGSLSQFLNTALQMASMANKQVESDEATIEELAAEGLNND